MSKRVGRRIDVVSFLSHRALTKLASTQLHIPYFDYLRKTCLFLHAQEALLEGIGEYIHQPKIFIFFKFTHFHFLPRCLSPKTVFEKPGNACSDKPPANFYELAKLFETISRVWQHRSDKCKNFIQQVCLRRTHLKQFSNHKYQDFKIIHEDLGPDV